MKLIIILLTVLWMPQLTAAPFQLIDEYLYAENRIADHTAYRAHVTSFEKQFDYICPDTFCEGEYVNLESMNFDCTVDTISKTVTTCVWHFYGSESDVNAESGAISYHSDQYDCRFDPNINVDSFLAFMAEAANVPRMSYKGIRDTKLPGQSNSVWDVLVGCL